MSISLYFFLSYHGQRRTWVSPEVDSWNVTVIPSTRSLGAFWSFYCRLYSTLRPSLSVLSVPSVPDLSSVQLFGAAVAGIPSGGVNCRCGCGCRCRRDGRIAHQPRAHAAVQDFTVGGGEEHRRRKSRFFTGDTVLQVFTSYLAFDPFWKCCCPSFRNVDYWDTNDVIFFTCVDMSTELEFRVIWDSYQFIVKIIQ